MSNIQKVSWANALNNGDFICIETYSGHRRTGFDPEGKQYLLSPDSSDTLLGQAVLDALGESRFLTVEQAHSFFDYEGVKQRYTDWVDNLMRHYGYKNKRALFENMRCCWIEQRDLLITIRPTHHDKLEGWSGDGISSTDFVTVSRQSPEEVGAALRLGFDRCT